MTQNEAKEAPDGTVDLLRALTEAHGAPGSEDAVRDIFVDRLSGVPGLAISSDGSGNCFAELPGPEGAPRVAVAGHMDEVGMMVQRITKEGFIQFTPLGGWWGHTLLAQRVRILTRGGHEVTGIIASTPPHFLEESARERVVAPEKMFIDAGASERDEVEALGVRVGDAIVPDVAFTALAHPGRYAAKAFDNRVGIALVIQALRAAAQDDGGGALPCRLVGVATVQEEVGLRGARTAGATAEPDVALVLEGPPADDTPGFDRSTCQGRLGGGVQVRVMDPSAIMNRRLVDAVLSVAEDESIPHQVTVRSKGGTDAGSFQFARRGVPCVVLGVPARYIHTHHSIIDRADYAAALALVTALVKRFDRAAVEGFTRFIKEA